VKGLVMVNFDNPKVYSLLIEVCKSNEIDPSSSLEAEQFFRDLLKQYPSEYSYNELKPWLDQQIKANFIVLTKKPSWIQNADWVFIDGKPATFVGQFNLPFNENSETAKVFHSDVAFYLFIGQKGPPVVRMQQF
jgi:hypothetical protein